MIIEKWYRLFSKPRIIPHINRNISIGINMDYNFHRSAADFAVVDKFLFTACRNIDINNIFFAAVRTCKACFFINGIQNRFFKWFNFIFLLYKEIFHILFSLHHWLHLFALRKYSDCSLFQNPVCIFPLLLWFLSSDFFLPV